MIPAPPLLPGRDCGACNGCCAFFAIGELAKPAGVLCGHWRQGCGCQIYESRPASCRIFYCGYRIWDAVPADWRPDQTHFVLGGALTAGKFLSVTVDPARPEAWRAAPYYAQIKKWARLAVEKSSQIVVFIGQRAIIVQPEQDIDLGVIAEDEIIASEDRHTPTGLVRVFVKRRRGSPRRSAETP